MLQQGVVGQQLAILAAADFGAPAAGFAGGEVVDQHFQVGQRQRLTLVGGDQTDGNVEQDAFFQAQQLQPLIVAQQTVVVAVVVDGDVVRVASGAMQRGTQFRGQLVDVQRLARKTLLLAGMSVPKRIPVVHCVVLLMKRRQCTEIKPPQAVNCNPVCAMIRATF